MASPIELLRRTARVLTDLELLAEAPAGRALDEQVLSGGSGTDGSPRGFNPNTGERERSLLDRHLEKLEQWLIEAEVERDHAKYSRPVRRETDDEFATRIAMEHRGRHYRDAAAREGCHWMALRRARQRAGVEPLYGMKPGEKRDPSL